MALEHIKIPHINPIVLYNVGVAVPALVIPFPFFEAHDIEVTWEGAVRTLGVDYNVVGTGGYDKGFPGGLITFFTPQANKFIQIKRVVPIQRVVDFPNSGPLQTAALNTELDKSVAIDQQLEAHLGIVDFRLDNLELGDPRLGRALLFPPEDLLLNHSLPSIGNRADQTLGFAGDGNIQMRSALIFPDKPRDEILPPPTGRINKVLGFDATGDNVSLVDVVAGELVPNADNISYTYGGATVTRSVGEALRERLSIKDFGANVGTGVQAIDDAALSAAITYMNALPTSGPGATLFYPDGIYVHSACPIKLNRDNCTIEGEGANSATIVMVSSGPWISVGNTAAAETNFITVRNLNFDFTSAPNGCAVAHLEHTFSVRLQEIRVTGCDIFVHLGITIGITNSGAFHTYVQNCGGTSRIAGGALFDLHYGGGLYISDCNFASLAAPGTAPAGKYVIGSETVSFTIVRVHQCYFLNYDVGLWIRVSSGATASDYIITNCSFVGMNRWGAYLETGAGSVLFGIRIINSQIDCYNQDGVLLLGVGQNDNHAFISNAFTGAGRSAFATVAVAHNIVFSNNRIANTNKAGTSLAAIWVIAGTGYSIIGNVGNNTDSSTRSPWGISMGANTDEYIVTGNCMTGTSGSYKADPNAVRSHLRRISGNAYASPANGGYAAVFGVVLDVAANWENLTPFVVDAIVATAPGTEFFATTAINGIPIGYSTAGTFHLEPGDYISVYSPAPSITIRTYE